MCRYRVPQKRGTKVTHLFQRIDVLEEMDIYTIINLFKYIYKRINVLRQ